MLLVIFQNWRPGFVRVEALHLLEFLEGCLAEIFLVDNAVFADDESLYSGHAVFGRRSHSWMVGELRDVIDELEQAINRQG